MTDRSAERRTVGVDAAAATDLAALMDLDWFEREIDAYRVAISVALARELEMSHEPVRGTTTKFNVGTLDSEGDIRQLVTALKGEGEDPYDLSERLAHAGLAHLKTQLVDRGATLTEVLFNEADDEDGS